MGIFAEYNKFAADYGDLCRATGITPRQAVILAVAVQGHGNPTHGGKVYLPLQLPDATVVMSDDPDLLDPMSKEPPFLKWGDAEKHSFVITEAGIRFVNSHSEIFAVLIPDAFNEQNLNGSI